MKMLPQMSFILAFSFAFHKDTNGPCFPYTGSARGIATAPIVWTKEAGGPIVIGTPQRGVSGAGWKNDYVAGIYVNLNAVSVIDLPEQKS
ncbi:hypothetical protein CFAM422_001135 [Trichoderma lentiforme]|uniref:Uncharacterized protein n=1 Tax=Trichoderma lentiforme TaxID=1567552 RepID=A0A9P4XND4_9HYPO|nr:hypothetical protein CFAM422_001135 [Trichoderma lentiforme]